MLLGGSTDERWFPMRRWKISIIGAGVVGQATGRGLLAQGHSVQFVDVQPAVVEKLRTEGLAAYQPQELLGRETAAISMLTVSTPTAAGAIDLKYLEAAAHDLGKRMRGRRAWHLVVVRSTVPPGTTEELVIPTIERAAGKQAGRDFGVCMNPEYLREATAQADFAKPWLITIGQLDERSGDTLQSLYASFDCPVYRMGLREAEMQKYVHNVFNAAKISFFNEMRLVCERLNIDADEVFKLVVKSAESMWNPAYGTKNMGPFNGMCLPKDTQAFYTWARERGLELPCVAAALAVNKMMMAREQSAERVRVVAQPAVLAAEPVVS